MADDVIAQSRVYEEVPIPRTERTRKVLRFGIGAVIPAEDAKRLKVDAAGRQRSVPMADLDESGAVVPLSQTAPGVQREPVTPPRKAPAKKAKAAKKAAKAKKAR